ncbi:hypothetical protein DB29_01055 [Shouchella clausii]|nr:hypothetical protein DB29_01055 [Shouchella clausii]
MEKSLPVMHPSSKQTLSFILWLLILLGQEAIARMKIGF